ncbi:peptidylprolyl isomerase [Ornithinibacillus xuwenensis]|uniref:peptidylprolyl isomerase n=1 Tax=Ornithinibacillus xuwenensis TaxID=3144668 RepID=A0ABU9XEI9_9BACI
MTKKLLLSIIVVLLITNVATMIFWKNDGSDKVADDDTEIDVNKPVATIDGHDVTYEDWMTSLRKNYGKKELKALINHQVVKKLAEEQNITISDKVIERDIAFLTTMQGLTSEKKMNDLEEQWREDITYRYQLEALLADGIQVSDAEVQSYYTKYDRQYQFSESMQLSHIVVPDMDTAEKVWEELQDGATFQLLAKEYSIDEDTRDNGGYLGFNSSETEFLPSEYFEVAEGLEDYSYSEPFAINSGVAILYLHKSLPDITFSYEELQPYIRNELALQTTNQNLIADPLWEKLDIEWVYDE